MTTGETRPADDTSLKARTTGVEQKSGGALLRNLLRFGRLLHGLGLDVHPGRMLDVVRALEHLDLRDRDHVRYGLRSLLVHRREDLARFDAAFDLFWRVRGGRAEGRRPRPLGHDRRAAWRVEAQLADRGPAADSDEADATQAAPDRHVRTETYSRREAWRATDFAALTDQELAQARAALAELRWSVGMRRTRRWTAGQGHEPDLRRLLRSSIQHGGEPITLPRRRRAARPRSLVLLCDVSGSMERYTRVLLHLAYALGRERVDVFLFATRLTRITRALATRRAEEVARAVPQAVPDWAGGTRIGEALKSFNFEWGRRVLGRGAVVLLISDGWDRGDPELLRREVARLQRSCYRLIWLNPLLGSPAYEPLTRGMRAALPFVDDFLPVHNFVSLEALAEHLRALPPHRTARRQQVDAGRG